jgi:hypothetical protein
MNRLILLLGFMLLLAINNSCQKTTNFATIYGTVSDFATNEPISGVSVTLSPGGKNQITGNNGRFEFRDLDPQQYTVQAERNGYQTNHRFVTAETGEMTEVNIILTTIP